MELERLPDDVVMHILAWLPADALLAARSVSRGLEGACLDVASRRYESRVRRLLRTLVIFPDTASPRLLEKYVWQMWRSKALRRAPRARYACGRCGRAVYEIGVCGSCIASPVFSPLTGPKAACGCS